LDSDHWIAILIYPKISRVYVLDSLDKDPKEYEDIIGCIQLAYKYYVEIYNGPHDPSKPKEMIVKTKFPV